MLLAGPEVQLRVVKHCRFGGTVLFHITVSSSIQTFSFSVAFGESVSLCQGRRSWTDSVFRPWSSRYAHGATAYSSCVPTGWKQDWQSVSIPPTLHVGEQ